MENRKSKSFAIQNSIADLLELIPVLLSQATSIKQLLTIVGISSFASRPGEVGEEHLRPLLDYALKHIPEQHQSSTPLFLLATAGMRLLPLPQQSAILDAACAYARQRTPFLLPDCDSHFQVIDGKTEGLYGWISINYLLGSFDRPELHHHGKGHST